MDLDERERKLRERLEKLDALTTEIGFRFLAYHRK